MQSFPREYQLPFALLADPGGIIAKKVDSLRNLLLFKVSNRNSFIINPQGINAKIYRSVNHKIHVDEILKDLQLLQSN